MKKTESILCLIMVSVALCLALPSQADEGKNVDINKLRAAAESGNPVAEESLGMAYHKGVYGLAKNDEEAVRWFHAAAEQGNPKAQYRLADAYYRGKGVGKDDVQSYMWLSLVKKQNTKNALALRGKAIELDNELEASMTTDQIIQAESLAKQWLKAHPNAPQ